MLIIKDAKLFLNIHVRVLVLERRSKTERYITEKFTQFTKSLKTAKM